MGDEVSRKGAGERLIKSCRSAPPPGSWLPAQTGKTCRVPYRGAPIVQDVRRFMRSQGPNYSHPRIWPTIERYAGCSAATKKGKVDGTLEDARTPRKDALGCGARRPCASIHPIADGRR